MASRLYRFRDITRVGANYMAGFGLATTAFMLGNSWALVIGAGVSTAIIAISTNKARQFIENNLRLHPPEHMDSPNLRRMVERLYMLSGLNLKNAPVYDFSPEKASDDNKKEKLFNRVLREVFKRTAMTPNAAASNWGKPVIIISEPLLELLDDEEEYAVLGHEFAHAAAQHQKVTFPLKLVLGSAKVSSALNLFSVGAFNFLKSFGVQVIATGSSAHIMNKFKIFPGVLEKDQKPRDAQEHAVHKKQSARRGSVATASGMAAAGIIHPPFLMLLAGLKVTQKVSLLVSRKLSRDFEYMADRVAVTEYQANPLKLVTALRKMETLVERSQRNRMGYALKDLETGTLSRYWQSVTRTHPETPKRIMQLAAIAREKGFSEAEIDQAVQGAVEIDHASDLSPEIIDAIAKNFYDGATYE